MNSDNEIDKREDGLAHANKELFISLFQADKKRLYAYIFAFVANHAIADDIFQETSLTLWSEFSKFIPDSDFSKWSNAIAFNRIRSHRRKDKKYILGFSDEMVEVLSDSLDKKKNAEKQWTALNHCRSLLRQADQQLYEDFYVKNMKAKDMAEDSGRSIFAIRKGIHKLRKKLFDCVERKKSENQL